MVSRGKNITMLVLALLFVVGGIFVWVVVPGGAAPGIVAVIFFGAVAAVAVLELVKGRLSRATEARIMGAVSMLMGLGTGAMALVAWRDPTVFQRAPQPVTVTVGLIGLIFFGVGGLLLMIRGGRPFGVDRDGFRR